MKRRRSFLSILLVLCMLFQPFAPALFAASDSGAEASAALDEFNRVYDEVMALEEVELGPVTAACVGATSGVKNFGTWISNGWDKLTNDGKNQKEYVDYIGQIEDANKDIRDAKQQMKEIKAQLDAGNVQGAIDADPAAIASGGIAAQTAAMDTLRTTLKTAGGALQKVGGLLDTLSTVTSVISVVLKGIALAFPPSAGVIAVVSPVLDAASTAMGIAGPLISAAGDSLIETSEAAQISDALLVGNMVIDVATEGTKQVAVKVMSKGAEGAMGQMANYIDPDNADDILGTMTATWNPVKAGKQGFSTFMQETLFSGDLSDEIVDFCDNYADVGIDLVLDMVGKPPTFDSMVKDVVKDGIDYMGAQDKKNLKTSVGLSVD